MSDDYSCYIINNTMKIQNSIHRYNIYYKELYEKKTFEFLISFFMPALLIITFPTQHDKG